MTPTLHSSSLRRATYFFAGCLMLLVPPEVRAEPAIGSHRIFEVPTAQTMERGDATFDLVLDYATIKNLRTHVVGAVGLEWVDLGVVLPATLYDGAPTHPAHLDDLRVEAKVRFVPRASRWHVGAMLLTRWPTAAASLGTTGSYGLGPRLVADYTWRARFTFAGYLGYLLAIAPSLAQPTTGMGAGVATAHQLTAGFGIQVGAVRGKVDLFGEVSGVVALVTGGGGVVDAQAGAKFYLPRGLGVTVSVGSVVQSFRVFAALTYELRPPGRPSVHAPPGDLDEDGVYDDEDRCPDEPVEREDDPDHDGCPKHASPGEANAAEALVLRLQEGILLAFDRANATLTPEAARRLAAMAPVIVAHPEWPGVLVAGYSDGKGSPEEQLQLSTARADAVKQWLVDKGRVAEERLWADGFGNAAPRRSKGDFYSRGFVKVRIGSQAGAVPTATTPEVAPQPPELVGPPTPKTLSTTPTP